MWTSWRSAPSPTPRRSWTSAWTCARRSNGHAAHDRRRQHAHRPRPVRRRGHRGALAHLHRRPPHRRRAGGAAPGPDGHASAARRGAGRRHRRHRDLRHRPVGPARAARGHPALLRRRPGRPGRTGRQDGCADPHRQPQGGRRRPHHQLGRGGRAVRRPGDRRRLRHGDHVRRGLRARGVRRRGDRARHRDLRGGPGRQGRPAPQDRGGPPAQRDRQEHGRGHAGGHRLRLRRPGRRRRRPHGQGTGRRPRRRHGDRHGRPRADGPR
ncbi:Pantothenate kinase type III, CoaX-like [Streptomyces misionensis JCM 4497]